MMWIGTMQIGMMRVGDNREGIEILNDDDNNKGDEYVVST